MVVQMDFSRKTLYISLFLVTECDFSGAETYLRTAIQPSAPLSNPYSG